MPTPSSVALRAARCALITGLLVYASALGSVSALAGSPSASTYAAPTASENTRLAGLLSFIPHHLRRNRPQPVPRPTAGAAPPIPTQTISALGELCETCQPF